MDEPLIAQSETVQQPLQAAIQQAAQLKTAQENSDSDQLKADIAAALKAQNAVLVAHYYTDADVQALAEETGGCVADSLEMARFGRDHPADTLVVAGVRFMGETAKILSPNKKVLIRRQGILSVRGCRLFDSS